VDDENNKIFVSCAAQRIMMDIVWIMSRIWFRISLQSTKSWGPLLGLCQMSRDNLMM